jgi:hypothetical protein
MKPETENLERLSRSHNKKIVRHLVTTDKFFVKDVIQTQKGPALVLQALKDEGLNTRQRIFTVPEEIALKDYEIER